MSFATTTPDYAERVWAGDLSTVVEAHARYREDPVKNLMLYASALYSFRRRPECAHALLALAPMLVRHQEQLVTAQYDRVCESNYIDRAEMLTTYFEWMWRQDVLNEDFQAALWAKAVHICLDMFGPASIYKQTPRRAHTYYLLKLTYAALQSGSHNAAIHLYSVENEAATYVKDPNQRARVFIKLGMLMRRQGGMRNFLVGFGWGIRGCLVRDVPRNVRTKGIAALVGITR